jgi:multiple sugar transport system permease protein/raffinose/stachyose/melibiose transport system permease protein
LSAINWIERQGVAVWRRRTGRLLTYAVLLAVTAIMLYPFWLMGQMSFRSLPQYYLGKGFSLTTWHDLFAALPIGREMLNSTLITVCSILVILAVSTTGGYALGTLRYRLSGLVFLVILAAMMVPMQSMIIPEYINLARLGWINHYYGAIAVYSALGAPFATFLMTTYFRRLPEDVIEAALIDGLGYATVFFRMMLPLAVPAIVTVAVLQFIQIWDDLLVGLLFLQTPAHRTITVGLETIPAEHFQNFPMEMAGSLVSALPAVFVYLVFQRYLIRGLTMGMSK